MIKRKANSKTKKSISACSEPQEHAKNAKQVSKHREGNLSALDGHQKALLDKITKADANGERAALNKWADAVGKRKALEIKYGESSNDVVIQAESAIHQNMVLHNTTGIETGAGAVLLLGRFMDALAGEREEQHMNGALDLLNAMQPQNAQEGMLCAQAVAMHLASLRLLACGVDLDCPLDIRERYLNQANKAMRTFSTQLETLNKLRTQGQQTITVQHVNVNQGGQAIVGNIQQGGSGV